MGQVRGVLGDNSLSKDERDKKAEDMTRDFWKNISGAKLSSGKTVGEVMKDSRDTVDATGKGGGGTTASKDEVALGSNLLKAFDQMRGDSNERLDKVVDALKGVAKLLTPGSPKAKGPEE
jgi:hypothetical protein